MILQCDWISVGLEEARGEAVLRSQHKRGFGELLAVAAVDGAFLHSSGAHEPVSTAS